MSGKSHGNENPAFTFGAAVEDSVLECLSVAVAPASHSPPFFDADLIRVMRSTFSSLQTHYHRF